MELVSLVVTRSPCLEMLPPQIRRVPELGSLVILLKVSLGQVCSGIPNKLLQHKVVISLEVRLRLKDNRQALEQISLVHSSQLPHQAFKHLSLDLVNQLMFHLSEVVSAQQLSNNRFSVVNQAANLHFSAG